ncbi:MAG: hypothetical protein ACYTFA_16265, partial [Planctomycetota bacterium]
MRQTMFSLSVVGALLCGAVGAAFGDPAGSAFTYQGQLKQGGVPVDKRCNFVFGLWDDPVDPGAAHRLGLQGEQNVEVTNGLFTVTLDFGASDFDGDARWLETNVCCQPLNCSSPPNNYTTLDPRQELTDGNTLDQAYDEGGAGAGRTITADSGAVNIAGADGLTVNGNVGIGTTGPSSKLHVEGSTSGDLIVKLHNQNNSGSERLYFGTTTSDAGMTVWGSTNALNPGKWRFFNNKTSANYDWITSGGVKMTLANSGRLGIGTTTPDAKLHVTGSTHPVVLAETTSTASSAFAVKGVVTSTSPGGYSSGVRGINNSTTGSGIGVYGSHAGSGWGVYGLASDGRGVYGNSTEGTGVHGYSMNGHGVAAVSRGAGISGAALRAESTNTTNGIALTATNNSSDATVVISNTGSGYLFKAFSPENPCCAAVAIKNDGTMAVPVLQVTGGLDVAETFPVTDRVEPGMVVEIDPDHAGKLRLARGAYNRRVAGVASGANGLPAGAILGSPEAQEDAPPIALSGRVWVYCDAGERPIELGDLLTTSNTTGHAMKVTDYGKAQGAIL